MSKKLAKILGIVFILVGVLGFINNPILGVFEVDTMHNIVHILLGAILVWGSKGNASKVLKIVAVVYLLVAILGFVMVPESGKLLGLVHVNAADNWLHLILAVVLFLASMGGGSKMSAMPPSQSGMGGGMGNM